MFELQLDRNDKALGKGLPGMIRVDSFVVGRHTERLLVQKDHRGLGSLPAKERPRTIGGRRGSLPGLTKNGRPDESLISTA